MKGNVMGTLILIIIAITVLYFVSCMIAPYKKCARCKGTGYFKGVGGGYRKHGLCNGDGKIKRMGAKQ